MFLTFSVCLFLCILVGFVLMSWWLFGFVDMICMMMKYFIGCMFIKSMDSDDSAMWQSCLKIKQVAKYVQGLSWESLVKACMMFFTRSGLAVGKNMLPGQQGKEYWEGSGQGGIHSLFLIQLSFRAASAVLPFLQTPFLMMAERTRWDQAADGSKEIWLAVSLGRYSLPPMAFQGCELPLVGLLASSSVLRAMRSWVMASAFCSGCKYS